MFADKVLKNGNIYSFDIKGRTAEGSAVAVTGEKITAVGTDKEIERFIFLEKFLGQMIIWNDLQLQKKNSQNRDMKL